jgi:hypothetical protein
MNDGSKVQLVEDVIEENCRLRAHYEDLVRSLWRVVFATLLGMLAFVVLFYVMLLTHISSDACTNWTLMVRDAAHEACCKGEVECPPHPKEE